MEKTSILFVCLGNICRSPAAEGILRHKAEEAGLSESLHIDSAGTYHGHRGELPDARMRRAAAERGYQLTHRARTVTEDDFELFDLIVTMDDSVFTDVRAKAPSRELAGKVTRMASFLRSYPGYDHIPDPYYEGREGFELVLNMLEEGCDELLKYLSEKQ